MLNSFNIWLSSECIPVVVTIQNDDYRNLSIISGETFLETTICSSVV